MNGENGVELCGSILVSFKYGGYITNSEFFRVSFHTAFIGPSNKIECKLYQISPENIWKNANNPNFAKDNFNLTFEFEDFCHNCTSCTTKI